MPFAVDQSFSKDARAPCPSPRVSHRFATTTYPSPLDRSPLLSFDIKLEDISGQFTPLMTPSACSSPAAATPCSQSAESIHQFFPNLLPLQHVTDLKASPFPFLAAQSQLSQPAFSPANLLICQTPATPFVPTSTPAPPGLSLFGSLGVPDVSAELDLMLSQLAWPPVASTAPTFSAPIVSPPMLLPAPPSRCESFGLLEGFLPDVVPQQPTQSDLLQWLCSPDPATGGSVGPAVFLTRPADEATAASASPIPSNISANDEDDEDAESPAAYSASESSPLPSDAGSPPALKLEAPLSAPLSPHLLPTATFTSPAARPTVRRRRNLAYACTFPGCTRAFSRHYNLKTHEAIHDPARERPHACGACPRAFVRLHDLERHRLTHGAPKPFTCAACGSGFSRRDALRRHALLNEACLAAVSAAE
ncbi:hypothetical protein HK405_011613 [Cladochytrium tenue]|nr:hypothetical protein HK405_011613 [Cladochytrium tenue]